MLIRGEDSAINLPSTLTEEEKWHYDLFGYLVLRQVVSPAEVERMLEIANRWFSDPETAPEPVNVTQDEYSGVLNNVQYGDRIFERLSLNEKVMYQVANDEIFASFFQSLRFTRRCPTRQRICLHSGKS